MRILRAVILAIGMMGLTVACGGSSGGGADEPKNVCGDNVCGDNVCGDGNVCGDDGDDGDGDGDGDDGDDDGDDGDDGDGDDGGDGDDM